VRRNLLPLLLLVLLLPVMASCRYGDSVGPTVEALGDLTLADPISAGSGEQSIQVQLLEVTADTRTPTGSECSSAGYVTVRLGTRLGDGAQEERTIVFSPCLGQSFPLSGNYYIAFYRLEPAPASAGMIAQSEYSLRVRVYRVTE
jgi:hypothetical protein